MAAHAQATKQATDRARGTLVLVLRTSIEWSVDLETNVTDAECSMATDAVTILQVLAGGAVWASGNFAFMNRREELK
jgi:hypothetical protein